MLDIHRQAMPLRIRPGGLAASWQRRRLRRGTYCIALVIFLRRLDGGAIRFFQILELKGIRLSVLGLTCRLSKGFCEKGRLRPSDRLGVVAESFFPCGWFRAASLPFVRM